MKIIIVLGNIGSGKSQFVHLLTDELQRHYKTLSVDLDIIGKEVFKNFDIQSKISENFGEFKNKEKFADRVFSCKKNIAILNKIIHPYIYDKLITIIEQNKYKYEFLVVEQSVFTGKDDKFVKLADEVIYVFTDFEIRKKRCIKRNMQEEDFIKRNNLQATNYDFKNAADVVIENNLDVESLTHKIKAYVLGLINE